MHAPVTKAPEDGRNGRTSQPVLTKSATKSDASLAFVLLPWVRCDRQPRGGSALQARCGEAEHRCVARRSASEARSSAASTSTHGTTASGARRSEKSYTFGTVVIDQS